MIKFAMFFKNTSIFFGDLVKKMVFSSITFLFYFLPLTGLIYCFAPKKHKNLILFIASLIFYAWGEPVYVLLMLASVWINYILGRLMTDDDEYFVPKRIKFFSKSIAITRKKLLITSLIINIGTLFFFKYAAFAISTVTSFTGIILPVPKVTLPIGISFYTFQILSYIVDLYRCDTKVQKSFIKFGTYISLFPQLIAGPIVRYNEIQVQLDNREVTFDKFSKGLTGFVCGLSKKVILANSMGAVFDMFKAQGISEITMLGSWIGIIAYTFQIYFDFSGYSDMAIGLGRMFGFEFSENFRYPYTSKSVTEFWRRWHISLGTWFKEYVYIPLGGSRVNKPRLFFNLFTVWFLTGLWHGASFNFIVWGLFYWMLLMMEKVFLLKLLKKIPSVISWLYLSLTVIIGWVFFSMDTLSDALYYIGVMFGFGSKGLFVTSDLFTLTSNLTMFIIAAVACTSIGKKIYNKLEEKGIFFIGPLLIAVGFILSVAYLVSSSYNPFLYFRF